MAGDRVFGPKVDLPENPQIGEQVHGGFRDNRHHQGIEDLADERHMGRDILRQTGNAYPEELMDQGNDEMMNAWGARGSKENYRNSPWAAKS